MDKKRILVIDDEENFLVITKLNLEGTGKYEVKTLSNAKNVLNEIRAFSPDVILLDLIMPGIGGLDACEALNKDSVGNKIPIIILSALDKEADKRRAYRVGVVDYLVKPIDVEELMVRLDKALEYK